MTSQESDRPLSNLRGAGVEIDGARITRILIGIIAVTLAVLTVFFFLVGLNKNNQISQLQHRGVPVTIKVDGCLGELGGTGSNAAGYSCKGTFTLAGSTHHVAIPGNGFRYPGSTVSAVTLRSDPGLVETTKTLATEHQSFGVFTASIISLAAFILVVGAILFRRKGRSPNPA